MNPTLATTGFARSLVVFGVAMGFMLVGMHPSVSLYDEGIVLVGAERVLNGELPYRDFWSLYAPAQFHIVAALFSLFGSSDLTLRVYGIAVKAAVTLLTYLLLARSVRPAFVWLGTAAVLGALTGAHNYGFPVFPALALSLLAVVVLLPEAGSPKRLWIAGACVGAATLFRQDLGLYAAMALLLSLMLTPPDGRRRWRSPLLLIAGMAALLLPAAVVLVLQVPAVDLFDQLVRFPFERYPKARDLPWPRPWSENEGATLSPAGRLARFAVYVPFLVTAGIVVSLLWRRAALHLTADALAAWRQERWLLVLLLVMNLLFTIKGWVRVEPLHMVQSLVLSIILIVIVFDRIRTSDRDATHPSRWRRYGLAPLVLAALLMPPTVLFGFAAFARSAADVALQPDNLWSRCTRPELPRLRCATLDDDSLRTVRYVMAHSAPGARIYVGAAQHDRFVVNALAIYFLAERVPATRWHELHPGLQTTATIQQAMIEEFSRQPPPLLVLSADGPEPAEPNASARSSGVTRLDEFMSTRYIETIRFGRYRVLARR